jgi:hypothetical protein
MVGKTVLLVLRRLNVTNFNAVNVRFLFCAWGFALFVLQTAFAALSVSWSYTKSVGLLGRGISPLKNRYLHTYNTSTEQAYTDIHASSGSVPEA